MPTNSTVKTISDFSRPNKNGRIRWFPTRYGWLFLVVLLGMLMGSINYNNNLGFLFTFLLGSMLLVSLVHSYGNIRGIAVDEIQALPVFETQDAIFELKLHLLPRQRMAVRFSLDDSEETLVDTVPGSCVRVSVVLPAGKRGRVSPRELHIISEYPFGLFCFHTSCQLFTDCLVYPKPVPVQRLSLQDLLTGPFRRRCCAGKRRGLQGLANVSKWGCYPAYLLEGLFKGTGPGGQGVYGQCLSLLMLQLGKNQTGKCGKKTINAVRNGAQSPRDETGIRHPPSRPPDCPGQGGTT